MGLISRVSSRTYRFTVKNNNKKKPKRCLPKPKSKTDPCPSGSDLRPVTRSDTTLRGDTGREPSWVCKSSFWRGILYCQYQFDLSDKDFANLYLMMKPK